LTLLELSGLSEETFAAKCCGYIALQYEVLLRDMRNKTTSVVRQNGCLPFPRQLDK
jgi:hypothetical protein